MAGGDPADPGIDVPDGAQTLRSFGEDSGGCLYLVSSQNVYRFTAGTSSPAACPHSPSPPDPPADTTRPSVALSSQARYLRRTITFSLKCSEDCAVKAGGSLKTRKKKGKASFRFKYGPVELPAASNAWTKIELSLGKPAFRSGPTGFPERPLALRPDRHFRHRSLRKQPTDEAAHEHQADEAIRRMSGA